MSKVYDSQRFYNNVIKKIKVKPSSTRELSKELGVDSNVLRGYLMRLIEEGKLRKYNVGRSFIYEVIE